MRADLASGGGLIARSFLPGSHGLARSGGAQEPSRSGDRFVESRAQRELSAVRVENGRKYSCSDPFRFLFLSVCFRICGIPFPYLEVEMRFLSVSEKSRFYMELTRIYSVFHPVFNLHKICLKIDMLKNIPITKYAC